MATLSKQLGSCLVTQIDMTAGDIDFTFNTKTRRALLTTSAASTNMFLVNPTTGTASFLLPVGTAPPMELQDSLAGQKVTFNGTNLTKVHILEELNP